MKKLYMIVLLGISLTLVGCVQQPPTLNQNPDQLTASQPTVYDKSCNSDDDCSWTCCGCINQTETCDSDPGLQCALMPCKCVNNICQQG